MDNERTLAPQFNLLKPRDTQSRGINDAYISGILPGYTFFVLYVKGSVGRSWFTRRKIKDEYTEDN